MTLAQALFRLGKRALLAGALLCAAPLAAAQTVMSINACTDQLALALLPPERITSVTWIARDPATSAYTAEAARVAINRGSAEEVLAQRPALVLAGTFGVGPTRELLRRTGVRMLEIPPAEDWAAIRSTLRSVAAETGTAARAETLIAEMDARLAQLDRRQTGSRPRVAAWTGGGASPGRGTLFHAILTAAGAENVGASGTGYGRFDLEMLLDERPDALVFGDVRINQPALRSEIARHPLVRRLYSGRQFAIRDALMACGTPRSVEAAETLSADLRGLTRMRGAS
jgi:iron complex transport system substrate-binding protein